MKDYPTAIFTSFDPTSSGDTPGIGSAAEQSRQLEQLSDDEFWAYARRLAAAAPLEAPPEEYLTCILNCGKCLMPLRALYEIVRPPRRIAPLPAMPIWMQGVLAWRGEVIAVVDLNAYLSGYTMTSPHEGMLVIANYADLPLGLLVSASGAVIAAQGEDSGSARADVTNETLHYWCLRERAACVKGARDESFILDMDSLLGHLVQDIGGAASYG